MPYANTRKKKMKKKLAKNKIVFAISQSYINNCIRKSWVTLVHFNFILNIISTLFYMKSIESYNHIQNAMRQQSKKKLRQQQQQKQQ